MRVFISRNAQGQLKISKRKLSGVFIALATLLTAFFVTPASALATVTNAADAQGLVINEAYTNAGSANAQYKNKFVELYNNADHDISLDEVCLLYRSATQTGTASSSTWLTGSIASHGHYLISGSSNGDNGEDLPEADKQIPTLNMQGSNGTLVLVEGGTLITGKSGDTTTWDIDGIIDTLGYGATNTYETAPSVSPANNQDARSITRTDGEDTDDNSADFTLTDDITPQNSASDENGGETGGESGGETGGETGTEVSIAQIQGTGEDSPFVDQTVTTTGVVTATYPDGGFNGYYIQTPDTGGDIDLDEHEASDAVFVYSPSTVHSVDIGDYVEATGTVSEYYGLTEIAVTSEDLDVLEDDVEDPEPATVAYPEDDDDRESLEGMLIDPQGDYTVSDVYNTNTYGEVALTASHTPLLNPSVRGIKDTETDAAYQAEVDRAAKEQVVLDDGASRNYLTDTAAKNVPLPYLSNDNPVRVGAATTFTKPVVLDYRNEEWKFQPTKPLTGDNADEVQPATFENTRTDAPEDVGGDIKLGTFNVLNYFSTTAEDEDCATSNAYTDRDGNPITAKSCTVRGAWDDANKQRQLTKIVKAINALGADVVSLEEIENSAEFGEERDRALATLVDALNDAAGAGTWDYVRSPEDVPSNEDVIRTAFIYKPAAVQTVGESEILLDSEAFNGKGREPSAQAFKAKDADDEDAFLVVANHFKSKGSSGASGADADQGDGAGAYNATRTAQAEALLDFADDVSDEEDIEKVFLVGDFNAYEAETPIQKILNAGYTNISNEVSEETGKYSYAYDGAVGSLDHVFANTAAAESVTDADIWNINSVESVALEYSRYNYNVTNLYRDDVYRSSDHDPVIVGLKSSPTSTSTTTTINLLGINDFHGRIDNNTVRFAATIEKLRTDYSDDNTLFISAGDNIGASLFASAVQQDKPTIDVLNALDLKASAVGNHEFDQGLNDLTGRVEDQADFDYLGANVYRKDTTEPVLDEYSIQCVDGTGDDCEGGVRVGVIGAVTQETPSLVSPGGITSVDFGDPVEAVNRVAAQLTDGDESNGEADVLVAEYHEGAGAGEPEGSSLEAELAASPVFSKIVKETSPKVSAIFTGHTHKKYAWEYNGRPIVQTGDYGSNIGQIVLEYDETGGTTNTALQQSNAIELNTTSAFSLSEAPIEKIAALESNTETSAGTTSVVLYRNVPRDDDADEDNLVATYPRVAEVKRITDAALDYAAEQGNVKVGEAATDITTAFVDGDRDDRASESTLGNLVADSLLSSLSDTDRGGAQIGVVNPGGLRDELYQGDITYAEANAVLPFLNNLWTTTLTGAQFKQVLEEQWQLDADGNVPSRPYLQLGVSKNVSYTYDPDAEQGEHITSITVDGNPIDPDVNYRIGSFSFLLQGGDNFRTFAQGEGTRDSGLVDRDAWIEYISDNSPLSADYARRSVAAKGLPTEEVTAGDSFTVSFSKLALTSLGCPTETKLVATINGVEVGSADVVDDAATLTITVPGDLSGAVTLEVKGEATGTLSNYPLSVKASQTTPPEPVYESLPTSITVNPDQVTVGDTTTVTAGVTNPNDEIQELASLSVLIPQGFEYVADSTDGASEPQVNADGRSLTFALGTGSSGDAGASSSVLLLADGELSLSFKLKATAEGEGAVSVSAGSTVSGVEVLASSATLKAVSATPAPKGEKEGAEAGTSSGNNDELATTGADMTQVAIMLVLLMASSGCVIGAKTNLRKRDVVGTSGEAR